MAQCKGMFKLFDEKGKNYSTLFCTLDKGHKGNHRHILEWPNDKKK